MYCIKQKLVMLWWENTPRAVFVAGWKSEVIIRQLLLPYYRVLLFIGSELYVVVAVMAELSVPFVCRFVERATRRVTVLMIYILLLNSSYCGQYSVCVCVCVWNVHYIVTFLLYVGCFHLPCTFPISKINECFPSAVFQSLRPRTVVAVVFGEFALKLILCNIVTR